MQAQEAITELLRTQAKDVLVRQYKDKLMVDTKESYFWMDSLGTVLFTIDSTGGRKISKVGSFELFQLKQNGLVGLLDDRGNEIISPIYDYLSVITPHVYRVRKYGADAIINSENTLLHDYAVKYEAVGKGDTYYMKSDTAFILRNRYGEVVPADPKSFGEKVGNYYRHNSAIKTTICEQDGTVVYEGKKLGFEAFGDFYLLYKNRKYGLLDQNLDTLITPQYKNVRRKFSNDGSALVEENGKYNILSSETGALLFDKWYDGIMSLIEGYVCYDKIEKKRDAKFFSKSGELLGQTILPEYYILEKRYLIAQTKGLHDLTIYDSKGMAIPIAHDRIRGASACGEKIIVRANNQKYGIYDKEGKELTPCKYDHITCYDNFSLGDMGDTLIVNNDKILATEVRFYKVVAGDKIVIENNDKKYGLIDTEGKVLLSQEYDDIKSYGREQNYLLAIKGEDKWVYRVE